MLGIISMKYPINVVILILLSSIKILEYDKGLIPVEWRNKFLMSTKKNIINEVILQTRVRKNTG
jgi:hypothetical protein